MDIGYNVCMAKLQTSLRLTPVAKCIIKHLAGKMGLSQAGVMETALRLLAQREKLNVEEIERELKGEAE